MADLTYDIATRRLSVRIGPHEILAQAGSGGRAGSKVAGAENWWLSGNVFATGVGGPSSAGTHRYGPVPMGLYALRVHESRENWIRLVPDRRNVMFGRSGFAIHGRGRTGSHGCIVPTDFAVVRKLVGLLARESAAGRPPVTLEVIATGTNVDRQLRTA